MRMPNLELTYPRPDIAVVTLNRPEKLNALSYELVESLHSAVDDIAGNDECRVVVLTGAGRGFCSGLDLTDANPSRPSTSLEAPRSGMRWQLHPPDSAWSPDCRRIRRSSTMRSPSPKHSAATASSVESTKQVLWANLEAGSLEAAVHVENRSQILASTGGAVARFSEEFRRRPR
jgi:hypothetical protein